MTRIFKYNDNTFQDPGPEWSVEDVKSALAQSFPEIAQSTTTQRDLGNGDTEIVFIKKSGTKGAGNNGRPASSPPMGETERGILFPPSHGGSRGDISLDQLSREFAALAHQPPITLTLTPPQAWGIAAQLQLALRHPQNHGSFTSLAYDLVQKLFAYVAITPALAELACRGWYTDIEEEASPSHSPVGDAVRFSDIGACYHLNLNKSISPDSNCAGEDQ